MADWASGAVQVKMAGGPLRLSTCELRKSALKVDRSWPVMLRSVHLNKGSKGCKEAVNTVADQSMLRRDNPDGGGFIRVCLQFPDSNGMQVLVDNPGKMRARSECW